jgi:hypothetical protein
VKAQCPCLHVSCPGKRFFILLIGRISFFEEPVDQFLVFRCLKNFRDSRRFSLVQSLRKTIRMISKKITNTLFVLGALCAAVGMTGTVQAAKLGRITAITIVTPPPYLVGQPVQIRIEGEAGYSCGGLSNWGGQSGAFILFKQTPGPMFGVPFVPVAPNKAGSFTFSVKGSVTPATPYACAGSASKTINVVSPL